MGDKVVPIALGHEIRLRRDVAWIHASFKAMAEAERMEVHDFMIASGAYAEIEDMKAKAAPPGVDGETTEERDHV